MKINEYIESGILETYVLGSSSEAENKELHYLKTKYPEIEKALLELETDLERMVQYMSIVPPPGTWLKIENEINELMNAPDFDTLIVDRLPEKRDSPSKGRKSSQFIEVEAESNHMRVHKLWRWVLAAIFILGKIFLGFAIYFYLENRQVKQEIIQLRAEIKNQKAP